MARERIVTTRRTALRSPTDQRACQCTDQRAEATLMKSADQMTDFQMGVAAYYKPGLVMRALRATLGDETFDRAMRTYSNEWQLTPRMAERRFGRVVMVVSDTFFDPPPVSGYSNPPRTANWLAGISGIAVRA